MAANNTQRSRRQNRLERFTGAGIIGRGRACEPSVRAAPSSTARRCDLGTRTLSRRPPTPVMPTTSRTDGTVRAGLAIANRYPRSLFTLAGVMLEAAPALRWRRCCQAPGVRGETGRTRVVGGAAVADGRRGVQKSGTIDKVDAAADPAGTDRRAACSRTGTVSTGTAQQNVRRWRQGIFKASRKGDLAQVRNLQS